ncbi:toll/interleukin-1 receptor domain-containing protein [Vibrio diabolicus]|uniref:toll/interleukin-1 receptor domain-containing protein n=1 Tax=Vibrio diabolicus TaxID=50719 RepID=UPI002286B530|nr:toll/interleukin-1 receptor domain-containing protein [Vibrio diabolicus]MCZ0739569.1 toll/interleukin-1 receptor domain-containing protein [Vibrio diabolicus]
MEKPTIFFSHSSVDKDYVSFLNDKISTTTSRTVDLFQSSDGQSIPFGNNWVHKIEENLDKAKVMFVFISPASLSSSWIYFESGFAYSRGVKVVPIGIKGIDVGSLKPPLNLLQGFNITSENGMNNIVTVLNREFNCTYQECFNEQDFIDLSHYDEDLKPKYSYVTEMINYISFNFPTNFDIKGDRFPRASEPLMTIKKTLENMNIKVNLDTKGTLYSHGLIAQTLHRSLNVSIKIDPLILSTYEDFINTILDELYQDLTMDKFWCNVSFNDNVQLVTSNYKVSSRLHHLGIEQSSLMGGYFHFNGLDFTVEEQQTKNISFRDEKDENVRIIFTRGEFNSSSITELISKMIEVEIIK